MVSLYLDLDKTITLCIDLDNAYSIYVVTRCKFYKANPNKLTIKINTVIITLAL